MDQIVRVLFSVYPIRVDDSIVEVAEVCSFFSIKKIERGSLLYEKQEGSRTDGILAEVLKLVL